MLKYCIFCGKELVIISSNDSDDGHAHAECLDCIKAFRFMDIPTEKFSLLIVEHRKIED